MIMPTSAMAVLGVDIGGSGIKGAPVDLQTGTLLAERLRLDTPQPATPDAVAQTLRQLISHFAWQGAVGCTFPAIVHNGVTLSAAHVDRSWINVPAQEFLGKAIGLPLTLLNDADAAGLAEIRFGSVEERRGTVIVLTLGTGIGSALVVDGKLVPNTELGHLFFMGGIAEDYCSARTKEELDLKWAAYAERLNRYLLHLELLFSPDLFIIGGGVSKKSEKFIPLLKLKTPVVPATLRNNAGIVGAALAASCTGNFE